MLLDVIPNELAHHLRRSHIRLGAQALEHRFLSGINQQCQAGGTVFQNHRNINLINIYSTYDDNVVCAQIKPGS